MRYTVLMTFFLFVYLSAFAQDKTSSKEIVKLMGCRFELTAVANSKANAEVAIEVGINEIKRIERLISGWESNSQTSKINRDAGIAPVIVDQELFYLIQRSMKVSELTNGAFDISFSSIENIWKFDGKEKSLPDSARVKEASSRINWQNIILDESNYSVFLKEEGMKIGFGSIGKGYAANRAKLQMEKIPGVLGGIVNASGDLMIWGESIDPEGWKIQIADPRNEFQYLGWLTFHDMSIVTSGDYEKFFTSDGVKYSHIINPKTGYPVTETQSVTVISPDAEISDALATSLSVMGATEGLELINKLNHVDCIIIDHNDKIYYSKNLQLNIYK